MCEEKDAYFTRLFHYEGEGDRLRQWTFQEERISSPAWSPCGRYIAFLSDRTGVTQIYRMSRSGESLKG
ncbi:TolB family protein [Rossellomorea sp. H39__3]